MDSQARRDVDISLANYTSLIQSRLAAMKKVAAMLGPLNSRYQRAEKDEAQAAQDLNDKKNDVGGRPVQIQIENRFLFWGISILVAIAEVFANKELFDMMFLGSAAKSFIVATVLSVTLFVLAHTAGTSARQLWSDSTQSWVPSRIFLCIITIIPVLLSVVVLMIVRAYFETNSDTSITGGDIFGGLTEKAQSDGLLTMVYQAFQSVEALGLGLFNLICLIGAFLIGFMSHDSDIHYDKSYRIHSKTKIALEHMQKRYDKALNKAYNSYSKRIDLAKQSYVSAKAKNGEQVGSELPEDNFSRDRHLIEQETLSMKGTVQSLKVVS